MSVLDSFSFIDGREKVERASRRCRDKNDLMGAPYGQLLGEMESEDLCPFPPLALRSERPFQVRLVEQQERVAVQELAQMPARELVGRCCGL